MASLFMDVITNPAPTRVLNAQSEPFETTCFEHPYDKHPHHHRLICGHDIITRKVAHCASNCEPSRKAESKPGGTPFKCPHLDCAARARVMAPRRDWKTNRITQPRACELSHVYGRDADADQTRLDEKQEFVMLGLEKADIGRASRAAITPRQRALRRKRSQSPTARMPKPQSSARRNAPVDSAAAMNHELQHDPARDAILRFSGPGVRAKKGNRFETHADITEILDKASALRGLDELDVKEETIEQRKKRKNVKRALGTKMKERPRFPNLNFKDDGGGDEQFEFIYNVSCDSCGEQIKEEYYKCFDCDDVDICETCFKKGKYEHSAQHRMLSMGVPWQEDSRLAVKFCKCQSIWTTHMLLCEKCNVPFHPSCHESDHDEKQEVVEIDVGACTADLAAWKGGRAIKCKTCKNLVAESAKAASSTQSTLTFGFSAGLRKRKADEMKTSEDRAPESAPASELKRINRLNTTAQIKDEKPDLIVINDVEVDADLRYLFEEDAMGYETTVELGTQTAPTFTVQIPMR